MPRWLTVLRSPAMSLVTAAVLVAGVFAGGVWTGTRNERLRDDAADSRAAEESARREAEAAIAQAAAEATARQAVERETPLRIALAEATAARVAVEARVRGGPRPASKTSPGVTPAAPMPPAPPLPADDCNDLLAAVERERDAALADNAAKDAIIVSLRDAIDRTNERCAGLELALEQTRSREFKLAARSHRRGTAIAAGVALGLVGGMALSR